MPYKDPEKKRERHREYMRERYRDDAQFRERHKARVAVNNRKAFDECNRLVAEFKAQGCRVCGEAIPVCLSAHHRDPEHKRFTIGRHFESRHSTELLRAELAKCDCLCHNCHAKLHAGLIG